MNNPRFLINIVAILRKSTSFCFLGLDNKNTEKLVEYGCMLLELSARKTFWHIINYVKDHIFVNSMMLSKCNQVVLVLYESNSLTIEHKKYTLAQSRSPG